MDVLSDCSIWLPYLKRGVYLIALREQREFVSAARELFHTEEKGSVKSV